MTEPIKDGVDALRAAVRSRNRTPTALKLTADDVPGVGIRALEDFGNGKANLTDEQLCALAKSLLPYGCFDPETRILKSTNTAKPLSFITPDRYVPPKDHVMPTNERGLHMPASDKPQPKKSRAGWLGSWL